MGDYPGTFLRIQRHFYEIIRGVGAQTVKSSESIIQKEIIGQQQLAKIRRAVPNYIFEEKVERSPKISDDFRSESREKRGVLGNILDPVHLQPVMEEILHLGPGARIA